MLHFLSLGMSAWFGQQLRPGPDDEGMSRTRNLAPLINPKSPFELTNERPRKEFIANAKGIIHSWFKTHSNSPARVNGDVGQYTILPPHMIGEVDREELVSLTRWAYKVRCGSFLEGSNDNQFVRNVILKFLTTKNLAKVTEPLKEEVNLAISDLFTESKEWHSVPLRPTVARLVARMAFRIFLGEPLCRDEAWLELATQYATTGWNAANELRDWPKPLRPLVHWFLPLCTKARAQVKEARAIIGPYAEERRRLRAEGHKFNDALEWFEEASKGAPYDPAIAQLILSLAALHGTTDLICQVMTQIAKHPELIEPLRTEARSVIEVSGLTQKGLYQMKFMDSFVKECQRMKPIHSATMRRVALQDLHLSDGTVVPKGEMLAVSTHRFWDPQVHEAPDVFDAYRWLRLGQQPGKENQALLISTSPDHLGFSHGLHACPGRFFAAKEVKMALVHLLFKYEWKTPADWTENNPENSFNIATDPWLKIQIRRREQDIIV
ncbi:cytochrome P450 [Diaporthe sp. PMI_573]|nr:cytochrome P450 [Diaporthaceae sp. PMI_573]